jgi:integrase/recombinase XerD
MKIREATRSEGSKAWILLGRDYEVVAPVMRYVTHLEALQRSPNTIRSYLNDLKLFFEFLESRTLPWNEVEFQDLSEFIRWLMSMDSQIPSIEPRTSARTESSINRALGTVKSFYEFHERLSNGPKLAWTEKKQMVFKRYKGLLHHVAKSSPSARVVKLKEPKKFPGCLTPTQVATLLKVSKNRQERFLIMLLYETGMRIGEALNLKLSDVESGGKNVVHIIPRQERVSTARNKSPKGRKLDVTVELMRLFSVYLIEEYPEEFSSDYIFVHLSTGEQLTYSAINTIFRRLSRKSGVEVTPHLLRHTHATELIRSGCNIAFVQKRLGHAHFQTTINTYSHLTDGDISSAYHKFVEERG